MEENFEEQQVEQVKAWWRKYRMSIIGGLIAGAILVYGYNSWNSYRHDHAAEASTLYEDFTAYANSNQRQQMLELGQQLIEDYSATPYAELAALMMAKKHYETGEAEQAIEQLEWAMDHAEIEEVEHIARTRLARVYADQGNSIEALKLVEGIEAGPYTAWYLEVKGDIHVNQGDTAAARKAYQEALALKDLQGGGEMLQMKLDNLGMAGDSDE